MVTIAMKSTLLSGLHIGVLRSDPPHGRHPNHNFKRTPVNLEQRTLAYERARKQLSHAIRVGDLAEKEKNGQIRQIGLIGQIGPIRAREERVECDRSPA
jgi:hypothetical protein